MCVFMFWDNMGTLFRVLFGVMICVMLAGPVLIILGIVILSSPNNRTENVELYNKQGSAYSADKAVLAVTTGSINGNTLSSSLQPVPVVGTLDGVNTYTHYVFTAVGVSRGSGDQYLFAFTAGSNSSQSAAVASSFTTTLPWSASTSSVLYCTRTLCTSSCSTSSDTYYCSNGAMTSACQSAYSGTWTSYSKNGKDCEGGEACGKCAYVGQLTSACVVLSIDAGNKFTRSTAYTSCQYPFSSFNYGQVTSSSFTLTAISDTDPFLVLQRTTLGSNDFGITATQQRNAGIILLVIGLAITGGMGVALYCLIQRHQPPQQQQQQYAGAQPPYAHPPPQQQPAAAYGQPVYGQPVQQQQPYPQQYPPQQQQEPYTTGYPQQQQQQPNQYGKQV